MKNKAHALFEEARLNKKLKVYRKFGTVTVKPIMPGTKVETVVHGKVETRNTAKAGDVLVTGKAGEQYLLSETKLKERYELVENTKDGGSTWKAKGLVHAFQYKGRTFLFIAPWGENMVCVNGDYICSPDLKGNDIYRIEQSVFKNTYRPA